jgi:serine/threonine protein kinase
MQMIVSENVYVDFNESFTELSKDLISGLLQRDPLKRLTLALAKAHDWF